MQSPVQGKHLRDWSDVVIEKRRLAADRVAAVAQAQAKFAQEDIENTVRVAVAQAVERCAKIADGWASSKSCMYHDDNPCCHVRTGAGIAEAARRRASSVIPATADGPAAQDARACTQPRAGLLAGTRADGAGSSASTRAAAPRTPCSAPA